MSRDVPSAPGRARPPTVLRGGPVLDGALHVAFAVLTVASAVRYVQGHGVDGGTLWVLAGGLLLVALYAVVVVAVRRGSPRAPGWALLLVATWVPLNLLAPSFSWCAVALAFVVLRTLPFRWACGVIAVLVATVVIGWSRIADGFDPTVVVGPVAIAVLAVLAYRSLDREATERQQLVDELREAQGELADAQFRTGVATERARLSRDLHDSVAQDLSSINLLLLAAGQDWTSRPEAAQRHVEQAARTARDALEEVRRVVADLAPTAVPGGLVADLRHLAAETARSAAVDVEVRVVGDVVDPGPEAGHRARALGPRAAGQRRRARGRLARGPDRHLPRGRGVASTSSTTAGGSWRRTEATPVCGGTVSRGSRSASRRSAGGSTWSRRRVRARRSPSASRSPPPSPPWLPPCPGGWDAWLTPTDRFVSSSSTTTRSSAPGCEPCSTGGRRRSSWWARRSTRPAPARRSAPPIRTSS